MKIFKIWLISMVLLLANDINLEEILNKEIKIDKIILGETTFDEVKKYYGFGFKMYDYSYEGKSYKSKDMCLYDVNKKLYLHFSSSDLPSSFTFIDWVTISSKFDETIIPESECHIKTVSIHSKNYLGFTKQQIVKLFGKATDKGFRYKEKNEYYTYSIEKTIEGISMGRQRELYPSKSISFDFNKDGKVFKYTIGTPMEYGEFLESQNGKYQYLSQKEVQKIKESNKSYQIYQKLNKYDILMMLIKESNFFDSSNYRTYNLKYAGYMDAFMESKNTIRLLIHIKRDLTEDEKKIPSYKTIRSISYQTSTNNFHEYIHENGKSEFLSLKYPKVWLKIFNIYHLNKPKEYIFIKEKSYLYKKPNSKSKSKKFLIKNDCALILDKTSDGWYKVFYYHPHWHTNTIMWIKFDVEKHGLMG